MSEQLRHKMIEFEATPPHAAWKTIAERLDDDQHYAAVSSKMNNFTAAPPPISWQNIAARINDDNNYAAVVEKMTNFDVTPPASNWESISARLDDDNQYAAVATKMNNFDTAPPAINWEAIAARLDDDNQYAAVATKMNNFDAAPPQQIWNNIAASLEETKEVTVPVISIRKSVYRMAAAAVVISIFIGSWMFMNRDVAKIDIVKNTATPVPLVPSIKDENKIIPDKNNTEQKETIVAVQPASKNHTYTGNVSVAENDHDHILKYAVVRGLPSFRETPIVISSSPILDKEGNIIRDMDVLTTSNYLVVMGPNGQLTRISAKFASVIRYLNSNDDPEEYLDKVIKESDTWKKRFQEWRSKISQSSFIPSSANFLDIIEFKELIQEKQ